ncbi:mechanosensitive ion channel family protein [Arboricoccus pini]|uniref:mechanosensitive ion channel family protein n=1 Tax=Arboricoccus pini TaxID=1963835 RepID=UPI001A9C922A|nr:mechanosensitive ion channel domain-containing protein [Arboricoccus pini]
MAFLVLWLCITGAEGVALAASLPQLKAAPSSSTQENSIDSLLQAFPDGMSESQIEAITRSADPLLGREALRQILTAQTARHQVSSQNSEEMMLEFYSRRLREVLASYDGLSETVSHALRNPRGEAMNAPPGAFIATIVVIALASIAGSIIMRRWLNAILRRRHPNLRGFRLRAVLLASTIAAIASYALLIVLPYLVLHPGNPAAPIALELLLRQGITFWIVIALTGMTLAPNEPTLRLLPVDDRTAEVLSRAITVTMALILIPSGFLLLLWHVGLPLNSALALWLPASALPFLYLLAFLIAHRKDVVPKLLARFGMLHHDGVAATLIPLGIGAYLVAIWLLVVDASLKGHAAAVPLAIASFAILLAIPLAGRLINYLLLTFFMRAEMQQTEAAATGRAAHVELPDAAASQPALSAEMHVAKLMRAVWIMLILLGILVVAYIWGFDPARMGLADYGLRIFANVGIVILLGYVGWALIQRWIDRRLELASRDMDSSRAQRMQTLLPLFRNFLRIALTAIVLMIVLSSLGIEIGPLLAGAGVVGIAIGLGAQQTIADILAGVFFLFEDSFRMGDYVEVGNIRGTVEGISLRSLKLRHQRGMLHTLPFGQIKSLTNYMRDWSLMRLEFRLPVGTDLDLVRRLVKRVGEELAADPEMGPDFIQPPKSQGVRNIEGNVLVVGVKYITRPGRQFVIRRQAYQRILAAFEANGIELMGSGVVVRVERVADIEHAVLGAAASAAVESMRSGETKAAN